MEARREEAQKPFGTCCLAEALCTSNKLVEPWSYKQHEHQRPQHQQEKRERGS
jgi:hypothetical protein